MFQTNDENITEKLHNFIETADSVKKTKSIPELIELYFNISYDDIDNLYTLKYYVEQENNGLMDKVLEFINTLIDVYSKGDSYKLSQIRSINDFFDNEKTLTEKLKRLRETLRDSAGIIIGPVSGVTFKNGNLYMTKKELYPQSDRSFLLHIKSETELDSFVDDLFNKFSSFFSRERSNEIKEKLDYLRESQHFSENGKILCITCYDGDTIKYTLDNKSYLIDNSDGEGIFQEEEVDIEGFPYSVCLI